MFSGHFDERSKEKSQIFSARFIGGFVKTPDC